MVSLRGRGVVLVLGCWCRSFFPWPTTSRLAGRSRQHVSVSQQSATAGGHGHLAPFPAERRRGAPAFDSGTAMRLKMGAANKLLAPA